MKKQMKDYTGFKSGRLTAIKPVGKDKHGAYLWICQCDCGNTTVIRGSSLTDGQVKSCGCLRREWGIKSIANINHKHGEYKSRLYMIYQHMKQRCTNPREAEFYAYGGRGIGVCSEWINSYISFRYWAMKSGYQDNLTIDRIDNDKGYSPDNCRWATRHEQSRNTSRNILIEYNGKTLCLKDWSIETGIHQQTLRYRFKRGLKGDDLFYRGNYNYRKQA